MPLSLSQFHSKADYLPSLYDGMVKETYQKTLAGTISCTGIGVHSGKPATLTLSPGEPNSGYVFVRTDVEGRDNKILGKFDQVVDTQMCTKLANTSGVSIATVEHVLAALAGDHISNAVIMVNGPEVPIMDGSSTVFTHLIGQVGFCVQEVLVPTLEIIKPVRVTAGTAYAEFIPCPERLITLTFDGHGRLKDLVGQGHLTFDWDHDSFGDLLSDARTFGFYEDAQKLWALGLAKGASLENTVVIQDNAVINPEGLRSADELIRHKVLDAMGDLALAGVRILGHFRGFNSGHALNNQLLRTLFHTVDAWRY